MILKDLEVQFCIVLHCRLLTLFVSELLAEEIHLQSYSENEILSTSNPFVLAVPSKPLSNIHNKSYTRVDFDECSFCQ
jgi:hypothetical protein